MTLRVVVVEGRLIVPPLNHLRGRELEKKSLILSFGSGLSPTIEEVAEVQDPKMLTPCRSWLVFFGAILFLSTISSAILCAASLNWINVRHFVCVFNHIVLSNNGFRMISCDHLLTECERTNPMEGSKIIVHVHDFQAEL